MFDSISALRWYRMELKSFNYCLFWHFLHVVLKGTKENELSTCDSERKKTIAQESVFSLKNGLKRKVLMDVDPTKENRAIRDSFEKCLLCTLYQEEFILSSVEVLISQYMFNLTNVELSMCVMEYSDLFLNLIWTHLDIFVWKSMK